MPTNNVLELIGNTPIINMEPTTGLKIFAKAEFLNPGGSIKDRVAKHMLESAEKEGRLKKGMHITSPPLFRACLSISPVLATRCCNESREYNETLLPTLALCLHQ